MNIDHLYPCQPAKEWLLSQPDHQTAWDACTDPTWMIWYLGKTGCPQQTLVTIACRIARTFVHLAPPEALEAIEAAERWVLDPSEENRSAAGSAAEAAAYAAEAAAYAGRATYAARAAYVAYAAYAARAAYAAYAAGSAAYAAAYAARAAYAAADEQYCQIIREIVPECPK